MLRYQLLSGSENLLNASTNSEFHAMDRGSYLWTPFFETRKQHASFQRRLKKQDEILRDTFGVHSALEFKAMRTNASPIIIQALNATWGFGADSTNGDSANNRLEATSVSPAPHPER